MRLINYETNETIEIGSGRGRQRHGRPRGHPTTRGPRKGDPLGKNFKYSTSGRKMHNKKLAAARKQCSFGRAGWYSDEVSANQSDNLGDSGGVAQVAQ